MSLAYASLEWLGENWRIVAITALATVALVLGGLTVLRLMSGWKSGASWKSRAQIALLCSAGAHYSWRLLHFIPLSWRSTTIGIMNIAAASKAPHIMVMTTLVVDHPPEMATDPELKLLCAKRRILRPQFDSELSQHRRIIVAGETYVIRSDVLA